MSTNKI